MVNVNEKMLCENCFEEVKIPHCPHCGYDPSDSVCSPALLRPGSVLSEKYIVGGVIGMGGFGITYLAYDRDEDRKVAVKEYFPRDISHRDSLSTDVAVDDASTYDTGAEKFYDEAKIVADLTENPNIVKIYDIFRANNTVYLIMELLHGKNIKEYLRDCGVLDAPSVLYIARCVLNALSTAHSADVLHRDISPDNIILCGNGDIKLIDFGSARRVVKERTQNFSTIIKYGFAPPEQYRKKTEQGAWSDIYSLGATMYYALTGDIPADPMSRFDNDDTFTENNFGIDESLWNVIVKATKLNPEERYQNVEEMREALDKFSLEPKPVKFADEELFRPIFKSRDVSASAAPAGEVRSVKKGFWERHGRTVTVAAVSFAAAVTCISVIFALNGFKPQTSEPTSSESSVSEPVSSETTSSEASGSEPVSSEPVSSETSSSDNSSASQKPYDLLKETFPYFGEYETKAWYLTLSAREQHIYKTIYDGLNDGREQINFPKRFYTMQEVEKCYYLCVYDNPWICNVGSFIEEYFTKDAQSAYDALLRKVSELPEDGEKEISVCPAPYLVNELYDIMDETFISDCKEKYGISVSGYTVDYNPQAYSVQLKL